MNIDVKICDAKSSAASCHRVCIEICKHEHIQWQCVHNMEFCEKFNKCLNVKMCKFSKKNPEDGFPELLLLLYVVSCATLLVRIFRGEKLPAQSGSYREYFMSIGFAGFLLDLSCVYWFNWFILVLLSISLVLLVFN